MKRRQFVIAGVLLAGAAGTSMSAWLPRSGAAPVSDWAGLQQMLGSLQGIRLSAVRGWSPAQVFLHCAQSIEYSLDGFPEMKPLWFRYSFGPLAFSLFSARGAMRHPLDEPIPGAPPLDNKLGHEAALLRLSAAFERFEQHSGPLQPHFAYGELSHAEYLQAHIMHFAEHMSLLRPA